MNITVVGAGIVGSAIAHELASRGARVQLFRYFSARAPGGGVNVGVLDPAAFGRARPYGFEAWHSIASRERVELRKRDYFERRSITFARDSFLVAGRLPAPAL